MRAPRLHHAAVSDVVLYSNRHATLSAFIGGVAIFNQPLSPEQMRTLARIGTLETKTEPTILNLADLTPEKKFK